MRNRNNNQSSLLNIVTEFKFLHETIVTPVVGATIVPLWPRDCWQHAVQQMMQIIIGIAMVTKHPMMIAAIIPPVNLIKKQRIISITICNIEFPDQYDQIQICITLIRYTNIWRAPIQRCVQTTFVISINKKFRKSIKLVISLDLEWIICLHCLSYTCN